MQAEISQVSKLNFQVNKLKFQDTYVAISVNKFKFQENKLKFQDT